VQWLQRLFVDLGEARIGDVADGLADVAQPA
jgi:hypothetical protein